MTFAIIKAVVTSTISVEIRCAAPLLSKLVGLFQDDGQPEKKQIFSKSIPAPDLLPIEKVTFLTLQEIVFFLKQQFETLLVNSQHYFIFCCQDEVKAVRVIINGNELLIEDIDVDEMIEDSAIIYSSEPFKF